MTIIQKTRIANSAGTNIANVNASGEISVINSNSQAVTGPLTDSQLRASAIPVSISGTVTTGGLTDTQLRASAVPVSLTSTTITNFPATQAVTGTFFQATQPVSIASVLPVSQSGTWNITNISGTISLPTGASTSANQATEIASLSSIDTKLTNLTNNTQLTRITNGTNTADVTAGGVAPVGTEKALIVALGLNSGALPTGANTIGKVALNAGANTIGAVNQGNPQVNANAWPITITDTTNTVGVAPASTPPLATQPAMIVAISPNSPASPVSGTVTANQGGTWNLNNITGTVSLPTGASTSALQTTGNTSLSTIATNTTGLATQTTLSSILTNTPTVGQKTMANSSPIVIASDQSSIPVTGTFFQATQPVSATSLPLPTSASTSALQTTGNTSLSSIDTKTPALGQALNAASVPVVLTATQLTTLTPPSAITGFNLEATQLLVKAKTDNLDVLLSTRLKPADTLAGVTTVGTVSAVTAITNALPTGANVIGGVTQSGTWNITNISGTVSLPTGASTSALQTTGNTTLTQIDTDINTLLKPASTLNAITTLGTITNALPTGTNTIGNTNQTLATAEFAKITDGTNTQAVKAASTAPVVADPSSVVSLSPNTSTVATALAKAQNAVFTASDVGVSALGIRRDVNTVASTAGNYANLTVDQFGNTKVVGDIGSGVTDTATSFPVKVGAVFNATLPTVTTGQRVDNQADSRGRLYTSLDSGAATYSTSATFSPVAAATNIFSIIGSATKKVIITKIVISATATNQGVRQITLNKCSTADTGGTSTAPVIVPHDSNSPAGTASCKAYTANPTTGTVIGPIASIKQVIPQLGVLATTQFPSPFIFDFDGNSSQSVILNGVAQQLTVNLNAGTLAGDSFTVYVSFLEE